MILSRNKAWWDFEKLEIDSSELQQTRIDFKSLKLDKFALNNFYSCFYSATRHNKPFKNSLKTQGIKHYIKIVQ